MAHAGEFETSMMMVIRPELVGDFAAAAEVPKGEAFATANRGWTTKDRSAPGHIGEPAAANTEKGETLFSIFTEGAVKLIREMRDWNGQSWDGSTRAA
jgi:creatinine amidohydrolase